MRNLLVQFLGLFGVHLLDELGRNTAPDAARLDDRVAQYQRACGYDGAFAHDGMVEDGSAHADKGIVLHGGAVDGDVVADGHVVAYFDGRFLVERVQHAAVLYVHTVADADRVDVAAQHGVEPYATVSAHLYVAYDGGVVGQVAVFSYFGRKASY